MKEGKKDPENQPFLSLKSLESRELKMKSISSKENKPDNPKKETKPKEVGLKTRPPFL